MPAGDFEEADKLLPHADEVCQLLGLGRSKMFQLIASGQLSAVPIACGARPINVFRVEQRMEGHAMRM